MVRPLFYISISKSCSISRSFHVLYLYDLFYGRLTSGKFWILGMNTYMHVCRVQNFVDVTIKSPVICDVYRCTTAFIFLRAVINCL